MKRGKSICPNSKANFSLRSAKLPFFRPCQNCRFRMKEKREIRERNLPCATFYLARSSFFLVREKWCWPWIFSRRFIGAAGREKICLFVSLFSIPHESHSDGQKAENGVGRRGNFRLRLSTRVWMDIKVSVFIFEWTFDIRLSAAVFWTVIQCRHFSRSSAVFISICLFD